MDITGLTSQVELTQDFVNAFDVPLEATYVFPLPDRAAVTRMRMSVDGRVVEAKLLEREAARRAYDDTIASDRRAAIVEEERPDVFTMRVGNILPAERVSVALTLVSPLAYEDGEATFRFPLLVAPRYVPGAPWRIARSATATPTTPTSSPTPRALPRRCCCPASRTPFSRPSTSALTLPGSRCRRCGRACPRYRQTTAG
ncbi:vault inter-alpha-trypsin domain protein [Mycobacterium kansasii]|uniref:Vault inter-alpha-trypsin domain protein n=1 Tax=Mycobacterium kansasii TaxID=1768 RepID=A0A1V3WZW9_MYCKA|nr:vault inter-alpha-trypsin domain protein [Mycobacterium kansasii]OOK72427.1 vault inter-alpha-trypsin domain protein [Mycobacterium kansasii]